MPHRRNMVEVLFKAGETIFSEGQPGNKLFIVRSGSVALTTKVENEVLPLTELGPGEVFGEMSLIDEKPRSATATAVTDVTCHCISKALFRNKFKTEVPKWMQSLYLSMGQRLRATTLRSLPGGGEVPARQIVELLGNYIQRGQKTYSGATYIPWSGAAQKIANLLNISEDTVEKIMNILVTTDFASHESDPQDGKRFMTRSPDTFFLFADYCWDSFIVDRRSGTTEDIAARRATLEADVELIKQILSLLEIKEETHEIGSKSLLGLLETKHNRDRKSYDEIMLRLKGRMLIRRNNESGTAGNLIIDVALCRQEILALDMRDTFEKVHHRIMNS